MSELQDLIERYGRGAEQVATAVADCLGPETDYRPAPGKWTVREILAHLADTQIVIGMRLRMILAQNNPKLGAFDQDLWAKNLQYSARNTSAAIETFSRLRAEDHELLKRCSATAFERTGLHEERGVQTLRQIVEQQVAHVDGHIRQMEQVRAAYKEYAARNTAAQSR